MFCSWALRFAALAILAGLHPSFASAQQLVGESPTAMFQRTLQAMGLDHEVEGVRVRFKVGSRPVAFEPAGNGKVAWLLRARFPHQTSLQTINRYNEARAITTRAIQYANEGLVLESGLDLELGVTEKSLAKYLQKFVSEVGAFEQFVQKDAPTANAKPGGFTFRPTGQPQPIVNGQGTPIKIAAPLFDAKNNPAFKSTDPGEKSVEVFFPTTSKVKETGWKITWDIATVGQANQAGFKFGKSRGDSTPLLFKIVKAYFKPTATSPWIQVLEDAHPSEFYVPYYFRGTRFFDLRDVGSYVNLSQKDAPYGKLLGKERMVMAEIRDRGPAYKYGNITRRAEELALWANFSAGNYTYLVEYGFQDDGTIAFRHSPTGYNYSHRFDFAHMHNCYWRVGIKLGPEGLQRRNTVEVIRLPTDPKAQGRDGGKVEAELLAQECFGDWNTKEFTRIRVSNPDIITIPADPKQKRPAMPMSYDLVPYGQGQSRHARFADEAFSLHDFWVTRADCPEKMYVNLHKYFEAPGRPGVLEQKAPLGNGPVVLWHVSAGLHVPRGEDGILSGNSSQNGQALVHYTQFDLVPRNVMTRTPIYRTSTPEEDKKRPGPVEN